MHCSHLRTLRQQRRGLSMGNVRLEDNMDHIVYEAPVYDELNQSSEAFLPKGYLANASAS